MPLWQRLLKAQDIADTVDLALAASGCGQARVVHKPRLLSDSGSSYVSADLAQWLEVQKMGHVRGAPYHPQTQGKIERWHQILTKSDSKSVAYELRTESAQSGGLETNGQRDGIWGLSRHAAVRRFTREGPWLLGFYARSEATGECWARMDWRWERDSNS